jgi:flagellar basal-body rod protein FlgF
VIDALSLAAGSMSEDIARLTSISQNLTNASTAAYKREVPLGRAFAQVMDATGVSEPTPAAAAAIDHRAGTLRFTGHALDLALEGDGYFEVQTESGPAYTRQGDFRLDAAGRLVTQAGDPVQGSGGPLHLSSAQPTVDREGRLFDGEKSLGQLKVVHFADPAQLQRAGSGLFLAPEAAAVQAEGVRVRQGHLEASNVSTAAEMVKLVETMRHFEATQKVVQGVDDMMERALRKLGEF